MTHDYTRTGEANTLNRTRPDQPVEVMCQLLAHLPGTGIEADLWAMSPTELRGAERFVRRQLQASQAEP